MSLHTVSTLTIALATFTQLDVKAINVGKGNPDCYQVYYRHDGKNRVMMVPRKVDSFEALQREVSILLSRSNEAQLVTGHKDGPYAQR